MSDIHSLSRKRPTSSALTSRPVGGHDRWEAGPSPPRESCRRATRRWKLPTSLFRRPADRPAAVFDRILRYVAILKWSSAQIRCGPASSTLLGVEGYRSTRQRVRPSARVAVDTAGWPAYFKAALRSICKAT
jgi:hypothetical protein